MRFLSKAAQAMYSMTGYGSAEGRIDQISYTVEIKTVNNRYLKSNIKLPEAFSFVEEDVEALLRKNLHRGTANYVLRLKDDSAKLFFDVDVSAVEKVLEKLSRVAASRELKCDIDLSSLLLLPGIVQPAIPDEEQAAKIKKEVLAATQLAIDSLKQMRAQEGEALAAELKSQCELIKEKIEQVRHRSGAVVQEYHDKLRKRVDELLAEAKLRLDEETLAREVAVFAERADISEEIARLESHLGQFLEGCTEQAYPGRKLDFIAQEMLRETNTIASKAADVEIARCIVEMKCFIDRIKEQVQNVE